jgi:hypothetical protein
MGGDSASSTLLFIVAAVFGLAAVAIWFAFLRPVPKEWLTGTITGKAFKLAGTYWQAAVGAQRGFRVANPIPIAECFVFEIAADGMPGPLHYGLNLVASQAFAVGQRVRVEYQTRGLPPLWQRVYVLDMQPAP